MKAFVSVFLVFTGRIHAMPIGNISSFADQRWYSQNDAELIMRITYRKTDYLPTPLFMFRCKLTSENKFHIAYLDKDSKHDCRAIYGGRLQMQYTVTRLPVI